MRMRSLPVMAAAIALAWAAAPPFAHAEDLMEIFQLARRADPVVAAADADRAAEREGVVQARAALLPQLSVAAALAQTGNSGAATADAPGRERSREWSATLDQVLLDRARQVQVAAARARSGAREAGYQAAVQALCMRVAGAYFAALSAADTLANAQANEEALRQQVEQSRRRYENGLSAAVDVEQARAYHAAAQADTLAARTVLDDAHAALAQLTGAEPGRLKPLQDELPLAAPEPGDPQHWVRLALERNPQLQAQAEGVTAAERAVDAARAAHWPTLSASLAVGRDTRWPRAADDTTGRTATTVGLRLSVPLFSGGAAQSLVRQAGHVRDSAASAQETQRRAITRATLDHYRKVLAGIDRIRAARTAVDAARAALASSRVGQQLGTQSMTDLLLAIQTLTAAQGQHAAARYDLVLNRLLLLQDAGALGERDLAAVNALLQ
jgi:outer membrane protein